MKKILLLLAICTISSFQAQTANEILNKTYQKLNTFKTLGYKQSREVKYEEDNYHAILNWDCYYVFDSKNKLVGFKYQIKNPANTSIYNGVESFYLDHKTKIIEVNNEPVIEDIDSSPFLYNSLITLRNSIPLLVKDESISKSVKDTLINQRKYAQITLNTGQKAIQNLGNGFDTITAKRNIIYKILIDKITFLPTEIRQENDENSDFVKTTFKSIMETPKLPFENSWFYSTYTKEYQRKTEEKQKVLAIGSQAPEWNLKELINDKNISLSSFNGKVVLLDFWIINCGSCIAAIPQLNALQEKYGKENFEVISINVYDAKEPLLKYQKKHQVMYPILTDGKKVGNDYGVYAYPSVFILDKTGKIIHNDYVKDKDLKQLEEIIKTELEKK